MERSSGFMGEMKKTDLERTGDTDELVWALFGVRLAICESEGSLRTALEVKEHELVKQLSSVIDPEAHADLPHATRAPSPSIF